MSFLAVAVSAGVDVEVEGALSSPVATVVAGIVGREGVLSFLDETVGSLAAFSLSAAFLTGGRRFLLRMVLDFLPGIAQTSLQRCKITTKSIFSFFARRVTSLVTIVTSVNRESHWSVSARSKDYRRVTQCTSFLGVLELIYSYLRSY